MSDTNYYNNVGCLFMFAQIYFKQQQGDKSEPRCRPSWLLGSPVKTSAELQPFFFSIKKTEIM